MDISMKEKAKVRELHDQIMAIADKYEMSMEELLDSAVEGERPEMESEMEGEEESPEMEAGPEPDRAKIAMIVGKMRRGEE